MMIYVAEIDGRPIAALSALYGPEDIIDTDWFQSEVMVLEEHGKPVWDGKSDITVRPATDTERAILEASRDARPTDAARMPVSLRHPRLVM
jgi:hypothetical protein